MSIDAAGGSGAGGLSWEAAVGGKAIPAAPKSGRRSMGARRRARQGILPIQEVRKSRIHASLGLEELRLHFVLQVIKIGHFLRQTPPTGSIMFVHDMRVECHLQQSGIRRICAASLLLRCGLARLCVPARQTSHWSQVSRGTVPSQLEQAVSQLTLAPASVVPSMSAT